MEQQTIYAPNKMGVMPVGKLLIGMSTPVMLSMFIQACYNIVDSIFVARVSEKVAIPYKKNHMWTPILTR